MNLLDITGAVSRGVNQYIPEQRRRNREDEVWQDWRDQRQREGDGRERDQALIPVMGEYVMALQSGDAVQADTAFQKVTSSGLLDAKQLSNLNTQHTAFKQKIEQRKVQEENKQTQKQKDYWNAQNDYVDQVNDITGKAASRGQRPVIEHSMDPNGRPTVSGFENLSNDEMAPTVRATIDARNRQNTNPRIDPNVITDKFKAQLRQDALNRYFTVYRNPNTGGLKDDAPEQETFVTDYVNRALAQKPAVNNGTGGGGGVDISQITGKPAAPVAPKPVQIPIPEFQTAPVDTNVPTLPSSNKVGDSEVSNIRLEYNDAVSILTKPPHNLTRQQAEQRVRASMSAEELSVINGQ